MACAALVHVGPAQPDLLGAVHARASGELLRAHAAAAARAAELAAGSAGTAARSATAASRSSSSSHEDSGHRGALPARARGACGRASRRASPRAARSRSTAARRSASSRRCAVIDDTAGTTRARTEWHWSAGVGERRRRAQRWRGTSSAASTTRRRAPSGRVWVGGVAARGAAGRASPADLSRDPLRGRLASCASAPRPSAAAATTCCSSRSDYRAPFGTLLRHAARRHRAARAASA